MEATIATRYRDEYLWAVDKPSGMLVHRGWGRDAVVLLDVLARMHRGALHPLHRLDRQTSGVVLIALDEKTARDMSARFEQGTIEKRYLALVRGQPPAEGCVDQPLPRREDGPRVPAESRFRTLVTAAVEPRTVSLVEVRPLTGRPHQVRRHMKHLGHPLIGDANYGKGPLNRAFRERYGLSRLALHASSLAFFHPALGHRVEVHAPLPEDLVTPLRRIGVLPDATTGPRAVPGDHFENTP